jgi:hypothetical protein
MLNAIDLVEPWNHPATTRLAALEYRNDMTSGGCPRREVDNHCKVNPGRGMKCQFNRMCRWKIETVSACRRAG